MKPLEKDYIEVLQNITADIRTSRIATVRKINREIMGLYLRVGQTITEKRIVEGYGKGVVERLSVDLKLEFPAMGLSPCNLWDMKRFYEYCKDADPKLRQPVAVLPWSHNLLIMSKTKRCDEALH